MPTKANLEVDAGLSRVGIMDSRVACKGIGDRDKIEACMGKDIHTGRPVTIRRGCWG